MRDGSKNSRSLSKDEKGVSPVVGTLIMVAIAVILAAFFVSSVGAIDLPGVTPVANVGVDNFGDDTNNITLIHEGGDDLNYNDTRIIITDSNDNTDSATLNELVSEDDRWSVGERKTFSVEHFEDVSFAESVEIRIADNSSNGTMSVIEDYRIDVEEEEWTPYVPDEDEVKINVIEEESGEDGVPVEVEVNITFSDQGYRVLDWGEVEGEGDFSVDTEIEKYPGPSLQAIKTVNNFYDLGELEEGDYEFTFRSWNGTNWEDVKTEKFKIDG